MALVLVLGLAACQEGIINSELEITDTNGGGTKTISVHIYKTGALNTSGDTIQKNDAHLPNGSQGIVDKLKAEIALEDAVVEIIESTDQYDVVGIIYTWNNIDEYNEKTKTLAKGEETFPATIEVNGDEVTFTENPLNFERSIKWALEAVYNDPEVYDPLADGMNDNPVNFDEFANTFDYVIRIGADSETVDFSEARDNETDVPSSVTVTGTIGEEPAEGNDETPVDETNTGNEDNDPADDEDNVPTAGENEDPTDEDDKEATKEDKKDSEDKDSKSSGGKVVIIILAVVAVAVIIFVVAKKRSK